MLRLRFMVPLDSYGPGAEHRLHPPLVRPSLCVDEWSAFCWCLQWGNNVWIFSACKCFIALYWLGWIIAALVLTDNPSHTFFLSNWGAWAILLYFLVSSGVCIYGIGSWNSSTRNQRSTSSVNRSTAHKNARCAPSGNWILTFHMNVFC